MIATLVLAALLDFGPERPLIARPELAPAPRMRERARVATSDRGALVVWSDYRSLEWNVYGARLDRDGTLLDEKGLLIASGIAGDVVWTGRAYLVAYAVHPIVYVRTVTPEGVLGDPIPIVDTEWVQAHTVRLATDGTTALLMTNSGRGAVLTLDGEKRRELSLGISPRAEFALDIAVSNDAYGLATIVPGGVAFRRIWADSEEAERILPGSDRATTVALGSDGSDFLAAFDYEDAVRPHLRAQRVGEPGPRELTDFGAAFPKIVWRGNHYLITFTRTANIDAMAIRASEAGEAIGEPVMFATATPPSQPDADRRPDGTGVAAWVSAQRVEVGFFDASDEAPSNIQLISLSAPEQQRVRVDARGSEMFSLWLEGSSIRLGRGIGGPATVIGSGSPIDVVVDGDVVWAIWSQYPQGVLVRRYTNALVPIDAAPLPVMPPLAAGLGEEPIVRVSAGGGSLLIVTEGDISQPGLHARVVRETGGALTSAELFLPTDYLSRKPAAVWNGSEFTIVWAHGQSLWFWWLPPVPEHLVMQRVGADGVLLDAAPVTISSEPRIFQAIESVRSGDDVVLVLQSSAGATPVRDTFAMRLSSSERHAIDNPQRRKLDAIATLGDEILMLWTTTGDAEYVLLSHELDEVERGAAPIPATGFDLASAGARPVVAYARIAEEHGRVLRAFVRTTLPAKHRTVRR